MRRCTESLRSVIAGVLLVHQTNSQGDCHAPFAIFGGFLEVDNKSHVRSAGV